MGLILILIFRFFGLNQGISWTTDFDHAKEQATADQKLILLSFSGSDWCIPCIKMEETFFEDPEFKEVADIHFVLLKADFPRSKKNQLDLKQIKQNEKLAEKYNPDGIFPLTLIMTPSGKVLQKYEGLPKGNIADFIQSLNSILVK
ncbi:MAG: thioredoxin family protein [Saprospiraceae bacterium]